MHIIARPAVEDAKQRHPKARAWLNGWWATASKAAWARLADVRVVYPDTDEVGQCLVFDVSGGYRLICRMTYANEWTDGTLLVKFFLSHADYDKRKWCKDCLPGKKSP